jgi:hypothetical protein
MRFLSSRIGIVFLIVFWLALVGVGLHSIFLYEATPGISADSKQVWPAESKLESPDGSASLLMIVHPRCPCSKASLGELEVLMPKIKDRVRAQVVFVRPPGVSSGWEQGELWDRAKAIPGVTVVVDEDGREADRFGSRTSGQVMLFGTDGRLMFSGGITAGRGHAGANAGSQAIESILLAGKHEADSTMVYGCPLFDESSDTRKGNPECKQP